MTDRTRISVMASDAYLRVEPHEPVSAVAHAIARTGLPSVIVCEGDVPIGIVSEHDLVKAFAGMVDGHAAPTAVRDLMTRPVYTVRADDMVEVVAGMIEDRGFRRVPVVDDAGRLTGVVRFTDVVRFHTALLAARRDELEARIAERTSELQAAHDALLRSSREDGLLGIGNRRSMDEALQQAHDLALRHGHRYGVALIDVDRFKAFNDRYGHPHADAVLCAIATRLSEELRGTDGLFRYGGEELLVLLPETTARRTATAAERLRAAVEELAIAHAGSEHGVVTVSVGGCALARGAPVPTTFDAVLRAADVALYEAKASGRNAVRIAPGADTADELVAATSGTTPRPS